MIKLRNGKRCQVARGIVETVRGRAWRSCCMKLGQKKPEKAFQRALEFEQVEVAICCIWLGFNHSIALLVSVSSK